MRFARLTPAATDERPNIGPTALAAWCLVGLHLGSFAEATPVAQESEPSAGSPSRFEASVRPLLVKHCLDCHNAVRKKGGIDLDQPVDDHAVGRDAVFWLRVAEVLEDRSMPPADRSQPSEEARQAAFHTLEALINEAQRPNDPGPGPIQRLTHRQYDYALFDLLGITEPLSKRFPADGAGGEGFQNNGSTLFVPPILLEQYLAAASQAVETADPSRYLVARPGGDSGLEPRQAARAVLARFARKAFRRPIDDAELERLLTLYQKAADAGKPFEEAVKLPLKAILIAPSFLFIQEQRRFAEFPQSNDGQDHDHHTPAGSDPYPISDHELAARLSFFLWVSIPDDELNALADAGRLSDPEVFEAQVKRMIADPKARRFAEDFADQWLNIASLRQSVEPDRQRFPEYDNDLREAMIREPIVTFTEVILSDRSLFELIDSEHVYVNARLARHYGVEGVEGEEFRAVPRPDPSRGGLLTTAGVLTLTSYPRRTSPVLRGKWVLEELLGTPPPPPPSSVGVLPEDDRPREGLTFRQRLEQHRSKPDCAACHAKLDPLGFGLEIFDPIGRIRTDIGGEPVDAQGVLTSGETFNGPVELKAILLKTKREAFLRNLAKRALSYALRRGLEPYDTPAIQTIVEALEANDHHASTLLLEVTRSYPFRHRRDQPPTLEVVGVSSD